MKLLVHWGILRTFFGFGYSKSRFDYNFCFKSTHLCREESENENYCKVYKMAFKV